MIYQRNRYYDPATGRFTQEDPIGLGGGMNAYGFAAGDRVNFSDPMGLCPPKDRSIEDCGSVQYWKDAAAGSSSMAGRVGNSIMTGLARVGEGAIAEAKGETVGGCGINYACGTVPDFGGAKSPSEYLKHAQKLEQALGELGDLEAQLARVTGPKAQQPIRELIDQLANDIKGHVKEMRQKWPGGQP